MKNNHEKRHSDITTLPILPGTLLLLGLLLVCFMLLLFVLYRSDMIELPSFLANWLYEESPEDDDDGFSEAFLASLQGVSLPLPDDEEGTQLQMNEDNLAELLAAASPDRAFYLNATVSWMYGDDYTTSTIRYITDGVRIYAESYTAGGIRRKMICDEESVYLSENGKERIFARTDKFHPMQEIGLPTFTRLQSLLAEMEDGLITLEIEEIQNSACIRATFTDPLTGVREIFSILPDCGVVISVYSSLPDGSTPYYAMTTKEILTDLQSFDPSIFTIPVS